MSTVKEFIDSIWKPAPELPDLEDDEHLDGTWATGRKKESQDDRFNETITVERRRLHATALDTDTEPKYASKIVSSSDVFGGDDISGLAQPKHSDEIKSSGEEDDEEEDDYDEDDDDDEEEKESDTGSTVLNGSAQRAQDSSDDQGQSSTDDEDDDELDEDSNMEEMDQQGDNAETIKVENALAAIDLDAQRKKGESIRKQLHLWDRLMALHIKLHAALKAYNQLPRGRLAKQLLAEADEETRRNYHQARKNAITVLETLLQAENVLLRGSKQTISIIGGKSKVEKMDDDDSEDEEVASSADENEQQNGKNIEKDDSRDVEGGVEGDDDDDDNESIPDYRQQSDDAETGDDDGDKEEDDEVKKFSHKGRQGSLERLENELAKRHKRFEEYRSATLKKWDERTRLVGVGASKNAKHNFSAFDSVVLKQIAQIMADKHRLIRRTQTKRSDNERIGGNPEASYDVEVFDDDDFYQQLLKDLIERKSADVVDPIEMSKQWLEMQKLRQKRSKSKKVDTKASKGRKIRYVVIPKLVNYFPSAPEKVRWTHETRNQLFKSLFVPASS